LSEIESGRNAKTMEDLCKRFQDEHFSKVRPATQRYYVEIINRKILPALKNKPVADVTYSDIDAIHQNITKSGAAYLANRTVAVLSKMFSLAIRWQWRLDNPAKGIQRNQEEKRHRYLSGEELGRLTEALNVHDDQQAANIIRLLLLTGARRGEVMAATWNQFNFETGIWTKPAATTKQNKLSLAIEFFAKSIEINPDFKSSYQLKGNAELLIEKHAEARATLEAGVDMFPEDRQMWEDLAKSYAFLNEKEKADAAFKRADELKK
jgi:integrase